MVLKCFPRYGKVDVVRYLMEDVPAVGRKLALIGDKVNEADDDKSSGECGRGKPIACFQIFEKQRTNMLPIHLAPYGRKVEVIRLLTEGGASPLDAQTA